MRELDLMFWLFEFLGFICVGLLVHSIIKDRRCDNARYNDMYDGDMPKQRRVL